MTRQVIAGVTDQTIGFRAYEADGTPIQLAHNSPGMAVFYRIDANGRRGTRVALTPLAARSGAGVHTDKSVTNMGSSEYHEVDLPDVCFATAGSRVVVEVEATALVAGTITTVEPIEVIADTLNSIAVALAGSSPVEPTGTTVFEHLEQIQDSIDTYIASVTAVDGSSGTIVGFPATLTIGNSYTTDGSNAIHVFIRDENDDPITSVGTHNFTDPDFSCDLIITNSGNAGRVRATVTYVDPGVAESYLKVEIPLSESSRAAAGAATMQCTLKWDGVAKTIATQTVTWVARI